MTFGITGNTHKVRLWEPVGDLVNWFASKQIAYRVHPGVAKGLLSRGTVSPALLNAANTFSSFSEEVDVLLSFGGDGTLLNTIHKIERKGTPVLGVNIGRLGFLADVEVGNVREAVERIMEDQYRIEHRMVLQADIENDSPDVHTWAMNEFTVQKSVESGMLSVEVKVDGILLNTYWSDGLIIATPTGSTAYSMAVGGPILVPGCGAVVLTPLAAHALTARPIILADTAMLEIRTFSDGHPYVFTADGNSTVLSQMERTITVRRADHTINLVKMLDKEYFQTLRSKLMWGARKT